MHSIVNLPFPSSLYPALMHRHSFLFMNPFIPLFFSFSFFSLLTNLLSSLLSPNPLFPFRPAVCIFYLVLRALDTVEDDMTIPVGKKVTMLREFHTHLYQEDWSYSESNEKDSAVLEEFPTVSSTACVFYAGSGESLDSKFPASSPPRN